jgi:uncharacterized protein
MSKNKPNVLDWIAIVLLIVGGLNWGLVGFFNWSLVTAIANAVMLPMLATIIYAIVGIAAIYSIFSVIKMSKK